MELTAWSHISHDLLLCTPFLTLVRNHWCDGCEMGVSGHLVSTFCSVQELSQKMTFRRSGQSREIANIFINIYICESFNTAWTWILSRELFSPSNDAYYIKVVLQESVFPKMLLKTSRKEWGYQNRSTDHQIFLTHTKLLNHVGELKVLTEIVRASLTLDRTWRQRIKDL